MKALEMERIMKANPNFTQEEAEEEFNKLYKESIKSSTRTFLSIGAETALYAIMSDPTTFYNAITSDDDDDKKEGLSALGTILLQWGINLSVNGIPIVGSVLEAAIGEHFENYSYSSILPETKLFANKLKKAKEEFEDEEYGRCAWYVVSGVLDVSPLPIEPVTVTKLVSSTYRLLKDGDVSVNNIANFLCAPSSQQKKLIEMGYGDEDYYFTKYNWQDYFVGD
jgi:hypothetical protein